MVAAAALTVVGGLTQAYGQIKAGQDQNKAYNDSADILEENAHQVKIATEFEVRKLKVMGRKAAGEVSAGFGASGVTQSGSALDVLAESNANNDRDVANTRREGKFKAESYMNEAKLQRRAGKSALESSQIGAVGALFSSAGSAYMSYSAAGAAKGAPKGKP